MMNKLEYHSHTTYCDGINTPADMAVSAYSKGYSVFGFSGHAPLDGTDYCMTPEGTSKYIEEVNNLKLQYHDRMEILLGIECDYYSKIDSSHFDYVIGSVHHLIVDGVNYSVDYKPEILADAINQAYSGDPYKLVGDYFEHEGRLFDKVDADIIGHFDLITKFNEKHPIFDISDKRYQNAWKSALDELLRHNVPFEVNTGAVSRGWRKDPYPSAEILKYIFEHGGNIIITSDCHSADTIGFAFEDARDFAMQCGFKSQVIPKNGSFEEVEL